MVAIIKKQDWIDYLRGIAVLLVVMVHTQFLSGPDPLFKTFVGNGARGVQLFFILSAFTLMNSIKIRHDERRRVKKFFIRRFFRVAPLFYIVLVVRLITDGLAARYWAPEGITYSDIILTFVFLNSWVPHAANSIVPGGWSIALEMNFYLLLPLIAKYFKTLVSTSLLLGFSFLLNSSFISMTSKLWTAYYSTESRYLLASYNYLLSLPSELPVFFMGIIVFLAADQLKISKRSGLLLFFASSLIILYSMFKSFGVYYFSFLFSLLVLGGKGIDFSTKLLLPLKRIGIASFSIYLIHFFVIDFFKMQNVLILKDNFFVSFIIVVSLTWGLSEVSVLLIEKPFIRIGNRLISAMDDKENSVC